MAADALRTAPEGVEGSRGSPAERLAALAAEVGPVSLAREHTLPVHDALEPLLAGHLQRGSTVAVSGPGATTLAALVAAGPVGRGSWAAVVGWPSFGLAAAHRLGMVLERVAVVADPPSDQRVAVLGALVGAFDVVVVPAGLTLGAAPTRRLVARLRERGSVLVRAVPRHRAGAVGAVDGADLHLRVTDAAWEGLGVGHGHLQGRRARIVVEGRRRGGRSRPLDLWLPGPDGTVTAVEVTPRAIPLHGGPRRSTDRLLAGRSAS